MIVVDGDADFRLLEVLLRVFRAGESMCCGNVLNVPIFDGDLGKGRIPSHRSPKLPVMVSSLLSPVLVKWLGALAAADAILCLLALRVLRAGESDTVDGTSINVFSGELMSKST